MDFNQKQLGQFGELLQRAAVDAVIHAKNTIIQSEPEVKILADSIANGHRLTTFQLKYQRFILPELNTHRVFSRNSRSSRATPIQKNVELVGTMPWGPIEWGLNQKGMVAEQTLTDKNKLEHVKYVWATIANACAKAAQDLSKAGIHKQIANRLLESFLPIETVLSSTEWDNFFHLRLAPDAQPEMRALAYKMKLAMDKSTPVELKPGEWHLPYISQDDRKNLEQEGDLFGDLQKISAARCARVSYNTFDGTPNYTKDLELFNKLIQGGHFSPLEHVATPATDKDYMPSNFVGWNQFRKCFPNENYHE